MGNIFFTSLAGGLWSGPNSKLDDELTNLDMNQLST